MVVIHKGSYNEKKIEQFYYITNDNEYMLIYPNYDNFEQKSDVVFQIAKNHQYN